MLTRNLTFQRLSNFYKKLIVKGDDFICQQHDPRLSRHAKQFPGKRSLNKSTSFSPRSVVTRGTTRRYEKRRTDDVISLCGACTAPTATRSQIGFIILTKKRQEISIFRVEGNLRDSAASIKSFPPILRLNMTNVDESYRNCAEGISHASRSE